MNKLEELTKITNILKKMEALRNYNTAKLLAITSKTTLAEVKGKVEAYGIIVDLIKHEFKTELNRI